MDTPWGRSQHTTTLVPGHVYDVSTAGHGGIICSKEWAEQNMSKPALDHAYPGRWAQGYAFEEDASWSIVCTEHPELFGQRALECVECCNAGQFLYRYETGRPIDADLLARMIELYTSFMPDLAAKLRPILHAITTDS